MAVLRFVFCVAALAFAASGALAAPRVALVVGNSSYSSAPSLPNPSKDAELMASTLERAGFAVTRLIDADRDTLRRGMLQFGRTLREQEVEAGLFYYAGHGVQVKGENYLIPVDASLQDEDEVQLQAVNVNDFLNLMNSSRSKVNIVILDACRDNPFQGSTRSLGRGLAPVDAPKGTYIAYATSPGQVALDGDGSNSPYTAALVKAIAEPGQPIERVFKNARSAVLAATGEKQLPWETSSITGEFYFLPDSAAPQPQPAPEPQPQPALQQQAALEGQPRGVAAPGWKRCVAMPGGQLCASGVLDPQFGNRYGAGNLLDGKAATAWVEGAKGDGLGEGVVFRFDSPRKISLLSIMNGYNKNRDIYAKNNRARDIVVTASDGASHEFDLLDSADWQQFVIGGAGPVEWVAVRIKSVYRGSKYRDTAISEMRVE